MTTLLGRLASVAWRRGEFSPAFLRLGFGPDIQSRRVSDGRKQGSTVADATETITFTQIPALKGRAKLKPPLRVKKQAQRQEALGHG